MDMRKESAVSMIIVNPFFSLITICFIFVHFNLEGNKKKEHNFGECINWIFPELKEKSWELCSTYLFHFLLLCCESKNITLFLIVP